MAEVMEGSMAPREEREEPLLFETAWEVCNQMGGIYTVLRSKVPSMMDSWGSRYTLIGPYQHATASVEFEEGNPDDEGPVGDAVKLMRSWGFDCKVGHWLVTGRPRVILLDQNTVMDRMGEIKYTFSQEHSIQVQDEGLIDQVLAFGYLVEVFFRALSQTHGYKREIIAQFHEWMGASAIPGIKSARMPIATVFTTHATMLGRYLAMNDPWFYDHLPFVNWEQDAARFNIEGQVKLERAAAHGAHVFTTVSDVTSWECEHLVGRKTDLVTPNGLNIERFTALHEFQNLHLEYKRKIHEFVMSHFFHSYSFDLDNTLYFFTSGRFEYRNKGFDVTTEALARLNWRMRQAKMDTTVVMFYITRQPYKSINPFILETKAKMEEMRQTCGKIQEQIGQKLFKEAAAAQDHQSLPAYEEMIEDYWKLRLRRTMQSWKSHRLPHIVTHDLYDDAEDPLLNFLRSSNLVNDPYDRVKVVYHPDFINFTNPLWGMDYDQFVRGCHMGVFPSYYEPWGYTPLECMARGVPSITSDLSGFGCYINEHFPDAEKKGVGVLERRYSDYETAANNLADMLWDFVNKNRRDRIKLRNRTEAASTHFDWHNLSSYYEDAHNMALQRAEVDFS